MLAKCNAQKACKAPPRSPIGTALNSIYQHITQLDAEGTASASRGILEHRFGVGRKAAFGKAPSGDLLRLGVQDEMASIRFTSFAIRVLRHTAGDKVNREALDLSAKSNCRDSGGQNPNLAFRERGIDVT